MDSSAIVLQRMPQQLEATGRRDDWTGVTDSATRRRLQNRHAQRIWRKRKQQHQQQRQEQDRQTPSPTSPAGIYTTQDEHISEVEVIHISRSQAANYIPGRVCKNMLPGAQARLDFYARRAYTEYMLCSPRPAALHTVVQLNVLHALMQNASRLRIKPMTLCGLDSLSPFNHIGPASPRALDENLPPSLQPTALQTSIQHRPWIDLFPLPELRDAILRLSWTELEGEISTDLLDVDEAEVVKPNLVVWGDAADPRAWEATMPFLRKWGWLVRGCEGLLESTNYWRERRGDRKLVIKMD
ncbi:hypothetical protein EKO04_008314 [Ascochyta lentis]|uniref:BZIP domain-containing protein n=1 Tax=Ascochyta lentis TaxID=205686 RepID=A0A8H7IZJ3_9PLEO|nr:hypothetical protein EKO04_008314 [Ascochyta lentis]